MSRTSPTINRRATTKPYILGIPTYPHLLQPCALLCKLRYLFSDLTSPSEHVPMIPGGRLLPVPIGLGPPLSQKRGPGENLGVPAREWRGGNSCNPPL
jgi:hypothetical protein